ncbi:MAG TPA: hypothetical protein VKE22_14970 [Haliangiales bacterium]|nr:hypothetical protein [Haliangiales bacterium]
MIELTGPQNPTSADVAAAFSRRLGRPVAVHEAQLADVVPTFTSFGVSEAVARLYAEIYAGFREGIVAVENRADIVRGRIDLDEGFAASGCTSM